MKYLRELMPRLRRNADVTRLDIFVPPGRAAGFSDGTQSWPPGDATRGYPTLRGQIQRAAPDVVFIPTARWLPLPRPTVVMVRNMEPLLHPFAGHGPSEAARNLARRWTARRACRRASRVIVVSEHVETFLRRRWHIPPERIGLVYHGVETPSANAGAPPAALARVSGPWIFTAGSIRPARGLEDALDGLRLLGPGSTLVIAGAADPSCSNYERALRARTDRAGLGDQVIWTGQLNPGEMAWCYEHATVFLTTTRAEACPNVALEAMSHGCSIVASDVDPMPEFFGDVARYYAPGDAARIAAALRDALGEAPAARTARTRRGLARAAGFTWDRTAERTVHELRCAVNHLHSAMMETRCGS